MKDQPICKTCEHAEETHFHKCGQCSKCSCIQFRVEPLPTSEREKIEELFWEIAEELHANPYQQDSPENELQTEKTAVWLKENFAEAIELLLREARKDQIKKIMTIRNGEAAGADVILKHAQECLEELEEQ